MVNFFEILLNFPQLKYERFFEVMRDTRKGGIHPSMYDLFLRTYEQLPPLYYRTNDNYKIFDNFNLVDISKEEWHFILKELEKRGIEKNKTCWHSNANDVTCSKSGSGKVKVSAAHSIQNNGVLSQIAENGHVMQCNFKDKPIGKNHASIFWGFCNTHDAIFKPIEESNYTGTEEQNFLFAYRAFVVSAHKKQEDSYYMNFDEQEKKDTMENKAIFDSALLAQNFSVIKTEIFDLPKFYPVVASTSFYLEFDFDGNCIHHAEDKRMEFIFITLLPINNKTYILLSYFDQDKHLYSNLAKQLKARNNLKLDITILLAAHADNVYFTPEYYNKFIKQYEQIIKNIRVESQTDLADINKEGKIDRISSNTPFDYLGNRNNISFFHD